MPNLKDARNANLEDFIKEHEGDLDKLDAVIATPKKEGDPKATPTKSKEPKS